jgi:hypothetical protein
MIFVKVNSNNEIDYVHYMPFDKKYGLGKTEEELRNEGYLYESLPPKQEIEGKEAVLKFDPDTKQLYYEYVDRQLTPEEKIQQLNERISLMQQAIDELLLGGM